MLQVENKLERNARPSVVKFVSGLIAAFPLKSFLNGVMTITFDDAVAMLHVVIELESRDGSVRPLGVERKILYSDIINRDDGFITYTGDGLLIDLARAVHESRVGQ